MSGFTGCRSYPEVRNNMLRERIYIITIAVMMLTVSLMPALRCEEGSTASEIDFPEIIVVRKRLTTWLGEGDFIGIHNGDRDAMIGVLYGTEDKPNFIHIISIWTRYLGVGNIYDNEGDLLKEGHPIPMKTMFAQRFGNIYEFNDTDDDGIFDSRKKAGGSDDEVMEPVLKRASLYTAWTPSEVKKTESDTGTREWTFSLTASGLKYRKPFGVMQMNRDQTLDEVSLTFHLYVDVDNNSSSSVPFYNIRVSEKTGGEFCLESSELVENRTYSGRAVDARFKYDHSIKGWDYDSGATDHSLMLSTRILFANAISSETGQWLRSEYESLISGIKAGGNALYDDGSGNAKLTVNDATDSTGDRDDSEDALREGNEKPRIIRKNKLDFRDNWQNVGGLSWTSDVKVDSNDEQMYFQVYGGLSFVKTIPGKGTMKGFWLIGGFSYPGGSEIFHDPDFTTKAVSIRNIRSEDGEATVDDEDTSSGGIPWIRVVIIAILLVIVVGAVYLIARRMKKNDRKQEDREKEEEEDQWEY